MTSQTTLDTQVTTATSEQNRCEAAMAAASKRMQECMTSDPRYAALVTEFNSAVVAYQNATLMVKAASDAATRQMFD